jgi:DNA-binding transcriptional ArsR family regulator
MAKHDIAVSEQDLEQLASLFRLLSDRTRLSILMKLAEGERNVTTLCEDLKLPQPTVSHHLALLRMSSIVGNRRAGKQVFYSLNGPTGREAGDGLVFAVQNYKVRISR